VCIGVLFALCTFIKACLIRINAILYAQQSLEFKRPTFSVILLLSVAVPEQSYCSVIEVPRIVNLKLFEDLVPCANSAVDRNSCTIYDFVALYAVYSCVLKGVGILVNN
jgi:hypothetical protein